MTNKVYFVCRECRIRFGTLEYYKGIIQPVLTASCPLCSGLCHIAKDQSESTIKQKESTNTPTPPSNLPIKTEKAFCITNIEYLQDVDKKTFETFLASLTDQQREIYKLCFIDNLFIYEIAESVNKLGLNEPVGERWISIQIKNLHKKANALGFVLPNKASSSAKRARAKTKILKDGSVVKDVFK